MVIQHNLASMNTNRQLKITTKSQSKSSEKLASGYKVNRASDDAAGLTISEKMRSQIRGLNKASENAQNGISLVQTAEGALNEVHSILHRMNELATQAANDTNTSADRGAIKKEIDELAFEIDRIQSTTQFNTMNLLDGSFKDKNLQVGALSGQNINIDIYSMDAHGLGLGFPMNTDEHLEALDNMLKNYDHSINYIGHDGETSIGYNGWKVYLEGHESEKGPYKPDQSLRVDSFENAGRTMHLIQNAVDLVSEMRSHLGAIQNRLEHTIANLDNTAENTEAAESLIRDTNMAEEMVTYSKNNILAQAGQAMLTQANSQSQGVLSLLQ